jgi:hypothetical protein
VLTRERSDGLRAMSLMKDEDPAPTDPNLSGFPSRRVDDQAKRMNSTVDRLLQCSVDGHIEC